MFDSSSKIPTALLAGNIADLGFFDECLSVTHKIQDDTIRGKYCKAAIPLEMIMPGVVNKKSATFDVSICLENVTEGNIILDDFAL